MIAQQGGKTIFAIPVSTAPKIDGILDEEVWKQARLRLILSSVDLIMEKQLLLGRK